MRHDKKEIKDRIQFINCSRRKAQPGRCQAIDNHVPCAFLATRSRSSSTMILNKCDMSPAKRKTFMPI